MVKPSGGLLSGNTKKLRRKRKTTVSESVKTFKENQKVVIVPASSHRGLPALRYSNRHGIVLRKQGNSYVVKIRDGRKMKELVVGSIHLRSVVG